jgi:hypothetical protein
MKLVRLAAFATLLTSPAQAQNRKDVAVTQVLSTSVTSSGRPIIAESPGQWHVDADVGGEPFKLLVSDVVEKGKANIVLRK